MREEIKNLISEVRTFVDETEDFIFENYKASYTLFNAEMEDIKENLALIETSFDTLPDESLDRVKENLNTIKENVNIIKDNYDANNLSTTSTNQESLDVNAYLDSIETIPEEQTQTEVLPNDFVQPYVEDAKAEEQPAEQVETVQPEVSAEPQLVNEVTTIENVPTIDTLPPANVQPSEPEVIEQPTVNVPTPEIIMPTGSVDLNTLDNITANISAAPVEQPQQEAPQIDASQIAFQSQPEEGINVAELDDLFNS